MAIQKTVKLIKPSLDKKVTIPAVLTIAGSDNSGGAGIEADLKTITAHGVYGLTCITALTAQNTQLVQSFEKTPEAQIRNILDRNFDDFVLGYDNPDDIPLKVIKTGMLTKEAVLAIKDHLTFFAKHNIKLIIDPVMISTSGSELFDKEAMKICVDSLIKQSFLVTPNFVEAVALLKLKLGESYQEPKIESIDDFVNFVIQLQNSLGCENLLVKGGHIPWDSKKNKPYSGEHKSHQDVLIKDVLYQTSTDSIIVYESEFIHTQNTHGTGCTLSSSIASNVAKGLSLEQSLPLSINYIHKGMLSLSKPLGHGHGPLNHAVVPESNPLSVIDSSLNNINIKEINSQYGSMLQYFKEHPKVKDNWKLYVEHPFIYGVSQNTLPFNRFLYYLKQDFYYLVNYAQIHALAASVAPNYQQIQTESQKIDDVMKEIGRHKERLQKKFNINYDNADLDVELSPGKACLEYCDYLLEVGKRENFLGIKVALAPCLHGYYEAGTLGTKLRKNYSGGLGVLDSEDEHDTYGAWIADYDSDWYHEAYLDGINALQDSVEKTPISDERLQELVEIFNKVTLLEVNFWNEVTDS